VGNFQQRFTQWHNKRKDRWGKLFGSRFDSVLLDEQGVLEEFSDHLGYRRKRKAQEARAWDEVYCLKSTENGSNENGLTKIMSQRNGQA
jgi:hypothetical protein